MKLQTKVLLVSLALTALFTALTALAANEAAERVMLAELGRRMMGPSSNLARRLESEVAHERRLIADIKTATGILGVYSVEVIDNERRVRAGTMDREVGQLRRSAAVRAAVAADGPLAQRYLNRRYGDILLISQPLWTPGPERRRVATLIMFVPLHELLASAERVGRVLAVVAAAFCLIAAGFSLFLLRMVLRPVLMISEATRRVGAGDYEATVPVPSRDELGQLAEAFNRMGEALSRTAVSRDRLEEALAIARATLDASADAILVVSKEGRIVTYNRRFLEMWGMSDETVRLNSHDNRLLLNIAKQQLDDPESLVLRSTNSYRDFEVGERRDLLRFKDGRIYERINRPYRLSGVAVGRTITFRDLTIHMEGVRALSQARDEAVESARVRSLFLANVSHELRTPLNAVIAAAGLLTGSELKESQKEHAEILARAARSLLELADDVLDFSKLEAGRMTLESSALCPREVLEDAAALVHARALEKGLALSVDPGPAGDWELLGDARRLRQVLLNLLTNAVKFTAQGEVEAGAKLLRADADGADLEFAVWDTGIGIAPGLEGRLFTPFGQDEAAPRGGAGAGLGLAISKSLVELMGGTIGYDSAPGQGSRFWFRLRFARVKAEDGAAELEPPREPARGPRDRQRVLVVEDNAVNRRLLVQQLERLGRPTVAVADGRAAVEQVVASEFSLVLMDCRMPEMDGYSAAAEIRRREGARRRVPIVAITANAGEEDRRRCLDAGMDDFLTKPVSMEALAKVLDRWDLPYDAAALASFGRMAAASPEQLAGLLADFAEDAKARLDELRAAHERGDREAAERAAHTVKGSAAAVGARGLRELASRLERALRSGEPVADLLAQAAEEARRAKDAAPKADGGRA